MDVIRFDILARGWVQSKINQGRRPGTIKDYRLTASQFSQWLEGVNDAEDIEDLKPRHIETYLGEVAGRTSSGNAANQFRNLKAFFNWCVDHEELDRSPMRKLSAPKSTAKPRAVVSSEDLLAIMGTCKRGRFVDHRDLAMIMLMIDSGPRREELATMDLPDLDMRAQRISILGKGRKYRVVPFEVETARALARYLKLRRAVAKPGEKALWVSQSGKRLSKWTIHDMLTGRSHRVGLHVFPHQLRHTMGSRYQRNGGNLNDLRILLGHASITTTLRYAEHDAAERALEAHSKVSPMKGLLD